MSCTNIDCKCPDCHLKQDQSSNFMKLITYEEYKRKKYYYHKQVLYDNWMFLCGSENVHLVGLHTYDDESFRIEVIEGIDVKSYVIPGMPRGVYQLFRKNKGSSTFQIKTLYPLKTST